MKKQFHFRNHPSGTKCLSYYKPLTWIQLNQRITAVLKIQEPLPNTSKTLQDSTFWFRY